MVIRRGPPDDPADQIPSFMKEFEKKKRTFPRGLFLRNSVKFGKVNKFPPVFRGMASYFPRFSSSSRQNVAELILTAR